MSFLEPRLDVLPEAQRTLWPSLAFTSKRFTLYGGTALALRLGHRTSLDFDFFCFEPIDPASLRRDEALLARGQLLQLEPNTLTVVAGSPEAPVKLSFFGGLTFRQIEPPQVTADGVLRVASLADLFATKLNVIYQRAEPKDYLDVHAILSQGLTLSEGLGFARAVFGDEFNAMLPLQAVCYFEEPSLRSLPERVKRDLIKAVQSV